MGAIINGIRLALRAVRRNVMRAALTVLGILIGVAAVVTVTALGSGLRDRVGKQIESIGSNIIVVFPEQAQRSGARGAQGGGSRLTDDDGRAIEREAVSVASVAPMLRTRAQIVHADRNWSTNAFGTRMPYWAMREWKLTAGEFWTPHDVAVKAKVVVLGETVKQKLFGSGDAVGQMVRIGRYPYRVIGVLEPKGDAPFGGDQDDMVAMPIESMRARVMKTAPNFAGAFMLKATAAETTEHAVDQIDSILRQRHHVAEGAPADFVIRTQKEFQEMQGRIYGIFTLVLIIIAGISLIVGGIGVMNIMLVSVAERTREIGIRMAIGAREHDIRTQFLTEAVVLAVLGGLAGAAIGVAAIAGLAKATGWPMTVSPSALTVSILVSAITGIAFGFFPARSASRLDPIEALRHE
jgi:putative ABC transport system permease protein